MLSRLFAVFLIYVLSNEEISKLIELPALPITAMDDTPVRMFLTWHINLAIVPLAADLENPASC